MVQQCRRDYGESVVASHLEKILIFSINPDWRPVQRDNATTKKTRSHSHQRNLHLVWLVRRTGGPSKCDSSGFQPRILQSRTAPDLLRVCTVEHIHTVLSKQGIAARLQHGRRQRGSAVIPIMRLRSPQSHSSSIQLDWRQQSLDWTSLRCRDYDKVFSNSSRVSSTGRLEKLLINDSWTWDWK